MHNNARQLATANADLEQQLQEAVSSLEVSPSKYEEAQERYRAVGEWLNAGSSLAAYRPDIYPQGSFALGTAVKPLNDGDHDVDAVCLLQADPHQMTQAELKRLVGDRLREHANYARMLQPKEGGRRCWTLEYADESKFHLDILPAVPDDSTELVRVGVPPDLARYAVCITDRQTWDAHADWPKSNPKGYALWFREQMRVILETRRRAKAKRIQASVEQVPDHQVTAPLQQAVQLLKRHRDVRYGDDEDRPISIIITTLAARAYENEATLLETLIAIIPRMRASIERRGEVLWVPNPVNPEENFADKWAETPRKAELFMGWLDAVEREHRELLTAGRRRVASYIKDAYEVPLRAIDSDSQRRLLAPRTSLVALHPAFSLAVPHREVPRWPVLQKGRVDVVGHRGRNGSWKRFNSGQGPLPKGLDLRFIANTDVQGPIDVFWQVVNTGEAARDVGQLRGNIIPAGSAGRGGLTRDEASAYTGTHWIECFIVQGGVCVARSGEYIVRVA
jgi:hypothetical protein